MVKISFISYLLTSIFSFSGLIIGIIASLMAEEEIKAGKEYFRLLQKATITIILFLILYFYNLNLYIAIIISLIFAVLMYYFLEKIPSYVIYPFLGVVFALSYNVDRLFFYEASLIFIYGLPTAALSIDFKKRNYTKMITETISFIAVSLALYLVYILIS